MAVKNIDRGVGYPGVERSQYAFGLYEADELYELETAFEDGEPAIWPRGDDDSDELPSAQGRCRRVSHDW